MALIRVVELQMGFQDVAFLLPEVVFAPHFQKIVTGVKASWPPHLNTVVGVTQGMLPVIYFRSNNTSFCVS